MFSKLLLPLVLLFGSASTTYAQQDESQSTVVLDEDVWVTFYDLPSRRFRAIRAAVLTRNYESATRDLSLAANYLSVEAGRSLEVLRKPLSDVVDQMRQLQENLDNVSLDELDALFGRAHWLLAQHYLGFARVARDARNSRSTALHLWATTHHIERAILWSDVAITREVHATLTVLQRLAGQLQDSKTSARAYRERPIVRAENLLKKIGKQIDRRVLLPIPQNDVAETDAERRQLQ